VELQHRRVELSDEEVDVVSGITDQRDALGVARKIVGLSGVVSAQ
jgi:hypothetical protein